jgi:hypothetical protein
MPGMILKLIFLFRHYKKIPGMNLDSSHYVVLIRPLLQKGVLLI